MKKRFDIKGILFRKESVAIMGVAAVFCAGLIVTNMKSGDIPLHDGDVLVDSRNVAQVEEEVQTEGEEENAGETAQAGEETAGGTFEEKRASLDLERNELIARYDETIKNSTSEGEKNNAIKQKEKLTGYMEQEIAVEGKIEAKNLPQSLVIITESTVTVTVDDKDLTQNTVAKICNIVMEETKRTADKIIIQSSY